MPSRNTQLAPATVFFLIITHNNGQPNISELFIIYFASAAIAVDSSHMTVSSSASWSRFSPPSNFVNGHVSTMWFVVCRWPQSQEGDWARPRLCMGLDLSGNGPSETMYDEGDGNLAVG